MFELTINSLEKLKGYISYTENNWVMPQGVDLQEIIRQRDKETIEDYDRAIKALESKSEAEEYRTPKKVDDNDDPIETRFYLFTCPTCGYHLSEGMKYYKAYDYCPHCGQALEWPEVEE